MNPDHSKHTLNLRQGDMVYLSQVYTRRGLTASEIIRKLVADHVDKLRSAEGNPNLNLGDFLNE